MIDRVAPTRRPARRAIGYQRWVQLLWVHWRADQDVLRRLIPRHLTLDLHDGGAWVSLVAFRMEAVRPAGLPPALGIAAGGVNIRTYVHRDGAEPGIYALSLDTDGRALALGGRAALGLRYRRATIRISGEGGTRRVALDRTGPPAATAAIEHAPGAVTGPAAPGSLDHFLVERYYIHADPRPGLGAACVRIHHPAIELRTTAIASLRETLRAAAGLPDPGPPALAHAADLVAPVELFAPAFRPA